VLGQTLTTEIGNTGSYAAAQTHNEVREHIAAADRRRISTAFNRLAAVYTFYNFGINAKPPLFEFVKDEDLRIEQADRDVKMYQFGWRPTREYIKRQYGMQDDDFELASEQSGGDSFPGFSYQIVPDQKHTEGCPCGCQGMKRKKSFFEKLFASKEEKEREKNHRLMDQFETEILKAAQEETDATVDSFIDAMGQAHDFDDAFKIMGSVSDRLSSAKCAALIDEVRYASSQIGAKTGQKGGRRA
jgi:phage gp29-like protein